jgi:hypothetical protein
MSIQIVYSRKEVEAIADPKTVVSYDGTYVVYTGSHEEDIPTLVAEGDLPTPVADAIQPQA